MPHILFHRDGIMATLHAILAHSPNQPLRLFRKSWRMAIGKAKPKTLEVLVTGAENALTYIDKGMAKPLRYYLTHADAQAEDWQVSGAKLPRLPVTHFLFVEALQRYLDRNILIKLKEWPEDRYLSANGSQSGTYGIVGLINVQFTDWSPTPNELLSRDWYATNKSSPISIKDELEGSFLDYAMSVIISRALPDVRDGLKPVHRRVVFAMNELGNTPTKAYKKSARVVGDVIGKYHPHGDFAVYETIVRMAQDFSMRYTLVDGQGNFGSIDGDSAAAMRYTEIRMTPMTEHLLSDLDMDTVDWEDNYDGSERIPSVLPARYPNLLVNGSSGIAVGMATNMPPHNLTEVINATIALIQNPQISNDDLYKLIPAPDFPTGGTIRGTLGARKAFETGRGRVVVSSKYHMEQGHGPGTTIVFTEIPYTQNKAKIMVKIAEMVSKKTIEGIVRIQDESDRDGMRIAIQCHREANPDVVLNNLLNGNTDLETSFSINNRAIVNGIPRVLSTRDILKHFVSFRSEVIIRRTKYEIAKALVRASELEGLVVALLHVDDVIKLIRNSSDVPAAKTALLNLTFKSSAIRSALGNYPALTTDDGFGFVGAKYHLTPEQVDKIIAMRLSSLTGLEKDRLRAEFDQLLAHVTYLHTIINDPQVMYSVMINELRLTIPRNDARKTMIDLNEHRAAAVKELIADDEVVVTMSRQGWIKSQLLSEYNAQARGGRGKTATALKEDDYVRLMLTTTSHQTIMLFTTHGRLHWANVYDLPIGSRTARGKPIQNFIQLNEGEEVTAMLPVREFGDDEYVFMATRRGQVKRTQLSAFSNVRSNGIIAMGLEAGDIVIGCGITDGHKRIMLFSNDGKAVHFEEQQVRAMGRQASGVRGMLFPDQSGQVVSLVITNENAEILCVCENGYGKRTPIADFTLRNRGGQGVIAINASKRNGCFIGAVPVSKSSEVMICSDDGVVIRMDSTTISKTSRNTQGVKLINLQEGAHVSVVDAIEIMEIAETMKATPTKVKPKVAKKKRK